MLVAHGFIINATFVGVSDAFVHGKMKIPTPCPHAKMEETRASRCNFNITNSVRPSFRCSWWKCVCVYLYVRVFAWFLMKPQTRCCAIPRCAPGAMHCLCRPQAYDRARPVRKIRARAGDECNFPPVASLSFADIKYVAMSWRWEGGGARFIFSGRAFVPLRFRGDGAA